MKKKKKENNKKILIISLFVILIIVLLIIFFLNKSKNQKIGKNSTSQEIVDYILDISSYETKIEAEIKSNKNTNKYVLKQQYIKDKIAVQEVLEPSNIAGVKIIKDEQKLKVENNQLNLTTLIEKYNYLTDNALDLSSFIKDYKENNLSTFEENNNEVIMETSSNNENKYIKNKKLYIDRNTGNPTKMEITDVNKNTTVYILYKEVKINSLDENNILAFNLYNMKKQI